MLPKAGSSGLTLYAHVASLRQHMFRTGVYSTMMVCLVFYSQLPRLQFNADPAYTFTVGLYIGSRDSVIINNSLHNLSSSTSPSSQL